MYPLSTDDAILHKVIASDNCGLTQFHVFQNQMVNLYVPAGQIWMDLTSAVGPEGWDSWWYTWADGLKVMPGQNFMRLIWCIVKDDRTQTPWQPVPLETNAPLIKMPATGRLRIIANDVPGLYWNNAGEMRMYVDLRR